MNTMDKISMYNINLVLKNECQESVLLNQELKFINFQLTLLL